MGGVLTRRPSSGRLRLAGRRALPRCASPRGRLQRAGAPAASARGTGNSALDFAVQAAQRLLGGAICGWRAACELRKLTLQTPVLFDELTDHLVERVDDSPPSNWRRRASRRRRVVDAVRFELPGGRPRRRCAGGLSSAAIMSAPGDELTTMKPSI